jgi:transcriptional regulator with XRE-family HTH domain
MGNGEITIAFGQVLRELRVAKKLTQEQLADLADFDRTFIGFLERGERSPSLDTVFALATALGIPANRLIAKVDALLREQ